MATSLRSATVGLATTGPHLFLQVRRVAFTPASPSRGSVHWKVTETPSVRFDVMLGFASRYQAWKYQVSPGAAETNPVGVGSAPRSSGRLNVPVLPENWISPGATNRPIAPPRQSAPWVAGTGNVKPGFCDVRKNPKEPLGIEEAVIDRSFRERVVLPTARTIPGLPVEFGTAGEQ